LTKNAINAARQIMVVIQGENKAAMLAEVLAGEREPQSKPIQLISPNDGKMIWLVEQESAKLLPENFWKR
jgi:6-phosphogluconolactonase